MITEVYMGPGDFRVSLNVETPELMNDIVPGGFLVVVPQHPGDPRQFTNDSLLAAARYTGYILETVWTNGILTMEGTGLDYLLGDLDGVGWPSPSRSYSGTAYATVMSLIAGGGIVPPIFSIGSTISGGSYTGTHSSAETVKEVMMQVMAATTTHYKISPNGEINAQPTASGDVYLNTPEIVFMRTNWGTDANWKGLPVDQVASHFSIREWLDASNVAYYGLSDTAISRSDTTSPLTTREIVGAEYKFQEVRLPYSQLEGSGAAVGDNVYIWDPGSGFESTLAADIIQFRGQYLQPVKHRVHEVTWPITERMGVYYRPNGTSIDIEDWIDLTHTVRVIPSSSAQTYVRALATNVVEGC